MYVVTAGDANPKLGAAAVELCQLQNLNSDRFECKRAETTVVNSFYRWVAEQSRTTSSWV
jgi:hypothetical protein